MAELNFGLLNPPGSQSIGNAFVQGMDQAAVARAQENQNALAQYTLSKARREDELTNKMLAGLQGATTIEQQAAVLRSVGKFKEANELITSGLEQGIKKGTLAAQPGVAARTQAQTTAAKLAAEKSAQDFRNQGLRDMANNSSDANIIAHHEDAVSRGMMTQTESDAQIKKLLAIPFDQRRAIFAQAGAPAAAPQQPPEVARLIEYRKTLLQGSPEYNAVTAMIEKASNENYQFNSNTGRFELRQGGGAAPVPRAFVNPGIPQGVTPLLQAPSVDEARRQALAMNAAGMPVNIRGGGNALAGAQPPAGAPPAVAAAAAPPSNPRKDLEDFQAVLQLERLGWRRTPEGNLEKISGGPADKTVVTRTPVQEVRFRKDLATDYTTVTATLQGMQDVLDSITDVRNSPGLAGATGIPGALYSLPNSQAAAAQTNLTNLKGKVTSLGQTLANASGKIGPMALQEWTIVRDMVAALDTAISKGEKITLDEINKIEFAAKNIAKRVQDKFEGQYGDELSNYPQFATVPEPKSRLSGKIKPAQTDQAALDWAAANPNDPRAAQIRQRNGVR